MATEVDITRRERALDWLDMLEPARWFESWWPMFRAADRLRIEQELNDDTMVIRAEMPGIDPEKDVEITLDAGVLNIRAERRSEETGENVGRRWSEFRYGSFSRSLRLPDEVSSDDVSESYRDGILEVAFPYKVPTSGAPRKVAVTTS
jgi:HSP20 family protein